MPSCSRQACGQLESGIEGQLSRASEYSRGALDLDKSMEVPKPTDTLAVLGLRCCAGSLWLRWVEVASCVGLRLDGRGGHRLSGPASRARSVFPGRGPEPVSLTCW